MLERSLRSLPTRCGGSGRRVHREGTSAHETRALPLTLCPVEIAGTRWASLVKKRCVSLPHGPDAEPLRDIDGFDLPNCVCHDWLLSFSRLNIVSGRMGYLSLRTTTVRTSGITRCSGSATSQVQALTTVKKKPPFVICANHQSNFVLQIRNFVCRRSSGD